MTANKGHYKPEKYGVVVWEQDAQKLVEAVSIRDSPVNTAKRADAKNKRQTKDNNKFIQMIKHEFPKINDNLAGQIAKHACQIGSRRVGRAQGIDSSYPAVVAYVRHNFTDYDFLVKEHGRDEARFLVHDRVQSILKKYGYQREGVQHCNH